MPKQIVVIGHHFVVESYQELIQELSKRFKSKSIELTLITPKIYKEKVITHAVTMEGAGFNHIKIRTMFGKSGRQHAHFYLGIAKVLKNIKPNLIYCMEEPNSIVSVQIAYLAKKIKSPVIFWSALNQDRKYSDLSLVDIRRYLYPWCINYTFNRSVAINALDCKVDKVIKERGYNHKTFIQNTFGVNGKFFNAKIKKSNGILKVIYVGLLEEYKGVKFLVESVNKLEGLSLDIVGDGSQFHYLKSISSANIEFHGYLEYSEALELMKSSDVLVLPSIPCNGYLEQFGRVLIEAMASGLCVIGSNIGGIGNVINDSGFLVEHSSTKDISDVLKMLRQDEPLLYEMKTKAYQRAITCYSYKAVSNQLADKLIEFIYE